MENSWCLYERVALGKTQGQGPPSSSLSSLAQEGSGGGALHVLVQTNFQVTAYLDNALHLAMLSLFVDIRVRLPNSVIGTISRASIKEAYRTGITAAQIINFLTRGQSLSAMIPGNASPAQLSQQRAFLRELSSV